MKKKLTIAILIPQLHYYYQNHIWRNACRAAEKRNINLIFLITNEIKPTYSYAYTYNSLFPMANNCNIDGILLGASMSTFAPRRLLYDLAWSFSEKPLVTFSFSFGENPAVLVDGKSGIHQAVEHLVTEHNVRQIAFLKGPDNNPEAGERYQAYKEAIKKAGLDFKKELIVQGSFLRHSGYDAAKELIKDRKILPEAMICANDEMCFGVMDFLQENNIKIPHDIRLVGFDNLEESKYVYPTLSTIVQPFEELMESAVDKLIGLIKGKKQSRISVFPSYFIPRQSCGCSEYKELEKYMELGGRIKGDEISLIKRPRQASKNQLDTFIDKLKLEILSVIKKEDMLSRLSLFFEKEMKDINYYNLDPMPYYIASFSLLKELHKSGTVSKKEYELLLFIIKAFFTDFYKKLSNSNNLMIRDQRVRLGFFVHAIASSLSFDDLSSILADGLPNFNISDCFIALYNGKVEWDGNIGWSIPDTATVIFDYHDGTVEKYNKIIHKKDYIPSRFFSRDNFIGAIFPIVSRDECFGYIIFSPIPGDDILLDSIHKNISSAIRTCLLLERVKEGQKKLYAANKKLEELSMRDELTGVYNRRGFFSIAENFFEIARTRNREIVVFFFDINWLKEINDTFGHREGDFAIKSAADILKNSFRHTDIIGRFGGDEFVVLSVDCKSSEIENIVCRFEKNIDDFNSKCDKPYIVSLSCGYAALFPEGPATLDELMANADKALYKDKAERKKGLKRLLKEQ